MATKPLTRRFPSPPGTASYPRLQSPDDRWGDPKYSVDLILDENDADTQKFVRDLREFYDECIQHEGRGERRKPLAAPFVVKPALDDDKEPIPGKIRLKLSMKAHVKTKTKEWDQRPTIVDAKRKPWPKDGPLIGAGSTIRVSFDAVSYNSPTLGAGFSTRLQAVQVIDLVEYVPKGSANDFEEVDGYEVEGNEIKSVHTHEVAEKGDGDF